MFFANNNVNWMSKIVLLERWDLPFIINISLKL